MAPLGIEKIVDVEPGQAIIIRGVPPRPSVVSLPQMSTQERLLDFGRRHAQEASYLVSGNSEDRERFEMSTKGEVGSLIEGLVAEKYKPAKVQEELTRLYEGAGQPPQQARATARAITQFLHQVYENTLDRSFQPDLF